MKDSFEVRELDTIKVVGKSESIKLFELLAKKGDLSGTIRELLHIYNEGLFQYYAQHWDKALELLTVSSTLEPYAGMTGGKSPSSVLIERCRTFIINPPGYEWNGIYTLASK